MQQNKQPRHDEHQTKRSECAGAEEGSVAAVCARVAKKILPFGKDEPQANLQKVEIFLSHLLALAHMFCELSERLTNTL